jgi:prepilin-type N-terminal cleavage/methylation domain-containing protein
VTDRGISLIEILVSVAIGTIVVAITSALFAAGTRSYSREMNGIIAQEDVSAAKNVLLDDLSNVGLGFVGNPFVTVTTGTNLDLLEFETVTGAGARRLCYRVSGGVLERFDQASGTAACGNGTPGALATNVVRFNVQLRDESRALINDANAVSAGARCGTANGTCFVNLLEIAIARAAKGATIERVVSAAAAIRN